MNSGGGSEGKEKKEHDEVCSVADSPAGIFSLSLTASAFDLPARGPVRPDDLGAGLSLVDGRRH